MTVGVSPLWESHGCGFKNVGIRRMRRAKDAMGWKTRECEGCSEECQPATIASCKSCVIVIYTAHHPMLIITGHTASRGLSRTTKRVGERATTLGFTSLAKPEAAEGDSVYRIFPFSLSFVFAFSFLSRLLFPSCILLFSSE